MCSLRCIVIGQKCPESFTVRNSHQIRWYFLVFTVYYLQLLSCFAGQAIFYSITLLSVVILSGKYMYVQASFYSYNNDSKPNADVTFQDLFFTVHVYIDLSISTMFQERLIILKMQDGTLQEREGVNENLKMKLIWPKERRIIRCQFCPSVCHSLLICIAKLV